ncbi:hypothetical protein SSX86_006540 [Deinandra increscens subsp. villosa]|uniref:Protein LNK1 n=1 Tax=Deinandra increscens subsp. villosa TaxID=3103831 RepID=A0AAP0DF13_9ASTR
MTDLSIYELEDIIWDDFEHSGDHIVPHSTEDHFSEDKCEGNNTCKKPRLEVTPPQSNKAHASGSVCQFKEERESMTLNKETDIIEKDSWSHIPDETMLSAQSGDTKLSQYSFKSSNINSGSELCTDEEMLKLKDMSAAVDRNSYNDLNLLSNDGDDKELSDLLYFGWPDIGNFEDMDRILSNCNSSFGLGNTGNEDELVWLRSEDPGGGYEEALKMDLKFPCSEASALTNVSQDHEPRESDNKASRFVSESKVDLYLKDQKEQSRQQNQTEGMKASCWLKTYGLKSNDIQISSSDKSDKPIMLIGNWQQNKYSGHDSVGYMKSSASGELDSLNVPEGSSISSELDEISPEATAFRQLQQVMLQLDVRTKLCIRDSLYRLARSAEQRHSYAGVSDSTANHGVTSGPLMTEGTSKYTGLMDMETDTNPIDRTIAHLLFHRPSDSSNIPTPSPLKLNTKVRNDKALYAGVKDNNFNPFTYELVHGSLTGAPTVAEEPSCQQTEEESDDKISST